MEREKLPICEVRETTMDDIPFFRRVQGEAWLATYPSPENGVSEEWVRTQVNERFTDKGLQRSEEFVAAVLADPTQMHRVAVQNGEVIGFVHAAVCEDGSKELKAIYVSPSVFGTGVGAELMEAANQWIDGAKAWLTVASYNQRAIRFYEKQGFKIVPGSESVYKEVIPVIDMVREASNEI